MKMKNKIQIFLLLVITLAGCGVGEQQSARRKALRVEVLTMREERSVYSHTYVGEIDAKQSVAVSAQMSGRIVGVYAERGRMVSAGELLLSIDSAQAVNARQSAEALLRQAEDGYARASVLYKEGGLTDQKRVEIEQELARARSVYASAVRLVEDCSVRAPERGVLSELRVCAGESVLPGVPLLTIVNMDGLVVKFAVPEQEIGSIRIGQKGRAMAENGSRETCYGIVVTEKSVLPNRVAHSYEVRASLEGPRGEMEGLLPGMICKVRMEGDELQGYVLPQHCIQLLPDGAKVWLARDGVATRASVSIGGYVSDGVLITSGLESGDKVITKGYQKLWQGAEIIY